MKVLVVVDMQNDFIDGALGTPEAQAIVNNVVKKISKFDGDVIYATKDTHKSNYLETQEGKLLPVEHCIEDTEGHRINDAVASAISHAAIDSHQGVSVFHMDTLGSVDLGNALRSLSQRQRVDEVIVVGLCTDICVISNALLIKAFLPEATITVDASCCAGVTPESHQRALDTMKVCQINVVDGEAV